MCMRWGVTRSIHNSMLQASDSQTQLGYLHSNQLNMNQTTESLIILSIIESMKIYQWQPYNEDDM